MGHSDRRFAQRFSLAIPLYVRGWKSQGPELKVQSVNVSQCGAFFQTDTPPRDGAMVHVRLEMPTEITGKPTMEWRCTAKVTRVQPVSAVGTLQGVSVRFDYYEVLQAIGIPIVPSSSQDAPLKMVFSIAGARNS